MNLKNKSAEKSEDYGKNRDNTLRLEYLLLEEYIFTGTYLVQALKDRYSMLAVRASLLAAVKGNA